MDTISFVKTSESYYNGSYVAAKIIINGEDFRKTLEKFHNDTYNYQFASWLHHQLNNPQSTTYLQQGDVAIFTCACTVDECGGLFCKVTEADNEVIWSDFHTVGNVDAHSSMGELHFDRTVYNAELDKLKNFDNRAIDETMDRDKSGGK